MSERTVKINDPKFAKEPNTSDNHQPQVVKSNSDLDENTRVIKSEQKYRQLVENSLQGIALLQDMKIVYVNKAISRITGYSIEELLSFSQDEVADLIHPDDKELVWGNLKKRMAGLEIASNYQFRCKSKNGKIKTLEVHAQKIEYEGKPAIQGIVLDITQRIEALKALEESELKFRTIFENSGIGMTIISPKGNFIKVNKSFADLFGYTCKEFDGIKLFDITHPTEIEHSLQLIKNLLQDKGIKTKQIEKKFVKKTGEYFWGLITITPIRDPGGNVSYLVAQLQDITIRRKAESKLSQYADELKNLNTSKDKFFSIISHDLRSPFNALLGISEYTSQFFTELSKDEIKESITDIHSSAKKVYDLMQNLLEWTQIQTGRLEVERSRIDLQELSNNIIELYKESAEHKDVKLVNNISDEIYITADKYMIEAALRNLISNGIKFTHSGGSVTVSSKVNNDFAEISVADTGIGINSDNQDKLFRIDEQFRKDGTANEKGTGLGLILCKEFVEKNGGSISLESKENIGSKFTFTVPLYNNSLE